MVSVSGDFDIVVSVRFSEPRDECFVDSEKTWSLELEVDGYDTVEAKADKGFNITDESASRNSQNSNVIFGFENGFQKRQ